MAGEYRNLTAAQRKNAIDNKSTHAPINQYKVIEQQAHEMSAASTMITMARGSPDINVHHTDESTTREFQ